MKKTAIGILFGVFALILAAPAGAEASSGYIGIGITIQQQNQDFYVADLKRGGPAERAGVLRGDYLLRIDGRSVQGLSVETVISLLRGEIGTPVALALYTRGMPTSHDVVAYREYIEVPCFIEGFVDLQMQGDDRWGRVSGYVGRDYVNWNVNYGRVEAYLKGENIALQIRQRAPGSFDMTGWIHNQYLTWSSYAGRWSFYQSCIPD